MLTAIHKFYTLEDWKDNIDSLDPNYVSVTVGQSQEDYDLSKQIFELSKDLKFLCIDVANGYREDFIEAVIKYLSLIHI